MVKKVIEDRYCKTDFILYTVEREVDIHITDVKNVVST